MSKDNVIYLTPPHKRYRLASGHEFTTPGEMQAFKRGAIYGLEMAKAIFLENKLPEEFNVTPDKRA